MNKKKKQSSIFTWGYFFYVLFFFWVGFVFSISLNDSWNRFLIGVNAFTNTLKKKRYSDFFICRHSVYDKQKNSPIPKPRCHDLFCLFGCSWAVSALMHIVVDASHGGNHIYYLSLASFLLLLLVNFRIALSMPPNREKISNTVNPQRAYTIIHTPCVLRR